MRSLYLDCSSGISGDMAVAALIDLGADRALVDKALSGLKDECEIRISDVSKNGIRACDFDVVFENCHDHDMKYLHGHDNGHEDHGHHMHRNLSDVFTIIDGMEMTDSARQLSKKIFGIVAEAEGRVHGKPVEEVHFHEVGAIDSIADIVSFSVLFDSLDIGNVIVPSVSDGHGTIKCQHGIIPVPVPTTVEIAERYGLTIRNTDIEGELVTPTGAAIVAAIRTSSKLPSEYRIIRKGLGAGKRDYECSGILRAVEIEDSDSDSDRIMKLETNIDDCSGECLGFTMELLLEAGAKDVCFMPIFMKKNRPAYRLEVICTEEDADRMESVIFGNTTTIGIRRTVMERHILEREIVTVDTGYGPADAKICIHDGVRSVYPEYESVRAIAKRSGMSFQDTYRMISSSVGRN